MNREEIKQQNSMIDIVERYGLHPNRAGFIRCPFHKGDNTASMKIYKDSYYCYGCNASGDIFSFVQRMDNCDFKTAFQMLGGTYQKPDFKSRMAVYHARKERENRRKEEARKKAVKNKNIQIITAYRSVLPRLEPMSQAWCDTYNELQKQLYIHGDLNDIPY